MKAQTWHGGAHFTLDEVPDPEPPAGYVLVEIDTTGICGTDVHVTQGLFPKDPPQILGHESSGIIVDVGEGVSRGADRAAGLHQPPGELLRMLVLPQLERVPLREPAAIFERLLRPIHGRGVALRRRDSRVARPRDGCVNRTRGVLPVGGRDAGHSVSGHRTRDRRRESWASSPPPS